VSILSDTAKAFALLVEAEELLEQAYRQSTERSQERDLISAFDKARAAREAAYLALQDSDDD
jgi:hypothetical protein